MAPKECWQCGEAVSRSATMCPHCGVVYPGSRASTSLNNCATICLLLGLVFALIFTVPVLCGLAG